MTTWALDFESRDYRFLAHESGILPTLQAMVTLTNTADMANSALARLSDAPAEQNESRIERGASAKAAQRWTPWSLENIREGFIQVNRWTGGVHTWLFRWTRSGDSDGDRDATDHDDDHYNMQSVQCSVVQCIGIVHFCGLVKLQYCRCSVVSCGVEVWTDGHGEIEFVVV